eukprot:CAMPEP_0194363752 /NCGR_PEP_ID=MMETSP0174-20130528/11604_1 /TAXON_ID=216777 /ORGANISM="Proboscia alata, Strain PI-D3" /LENGTH=410 /DNA_ID=CAMNT_0039137385 /DNA_START=9 /DNA_END=1241 /DNA_ORIENTATION=-
MKSSKTSRRIPSASRQTQRATVDATVLASVVVEIGSANVRIGFSGESTPRHILSSPFTACFPCPYDEGQHSPSFNIMDERQWLDKLGPFFEDVFINKLLIKSTKSRRVIILEQMITPTAFRVAVARTLFETLSIASVLFVPGTSVSALLVSGKRHGLVIDIGRAEARSEASLDGHYIPQTYQSVACGYENAVRVFQRITSIPELQNSAANTKAFSDAKSVFESVTYQLGGVPLERATIDSDKKDKIFQCLLPSTGKLVNVSHSSVLLAWDNIFDSENENSLTCLLLTCLKSCPIDLRKTVASNILVIGGMASIPGLSQRLNSELLLAVSSNSTFRELRDGVVNESNLAMCQCPFARCSASWIGASILGTMELSAERWMHQSTWEKVSKSGGGSSVSSLSRLVHDWLSLAN